MTNRELSLTCSNNEYYVMVSDFIGSFAKWTAKQGIRNHSNIDSATDSYKLYLLNTIFDGYDDVKKLSYHDIKELTSEDLFETIPNILELNNLKNDFIDLGALSRNVFYDIIRSCECDK